MTRSDDWVPVATYGSGIEVDIATATLQAADIPVRVRTNRAGVFGATFQGPLPEGATVLVPADELGRARDLLDLTPADE